MSGACPPPRMLAFGAVTKGAAVAVERAIGVAARGAAHDDCGKLRESVSVADGCLAMRDCDEVSILVQVRCLWWDPCDVPGLGLNFPNNARLLTSSIATPNMPWAVRCPCYRVTLPTASASSAQIPVSDTRVTEKMIQ